MLCCECNNAFSIFDMESYPDCACCSEKEQVSCTECNRFICKECLEAFTDYRDFLEATR